MRKVVVKKINLHLGMFQSSVRAYHMKAQLLMWYISVLIN